MDKLTYKNIHNRFKLNGYHITRDEIFYVAYCFIKEGEPFEQHVGNMLLVSFPEISYLYLKTA